MNKRCYNEIYCYFDEQGKVRETIMREIFVDYLKQKEENNFSKIENTNLDKNDN